MGKRTRGKTTVAARLNAVDTPLFLLDAARKVIFFNSGMERLTGWSTDDVLGRICDYATYSEASNVVALTGSIAPPPDVLQGRPVGVPTYVATRQGKTLPRVVHFYPLSDTDGGVKEVLGIVTPIDQPPAAPEPTAAHQLHAELAALRHQLRERFTIQSFVCRSPAMQRVLRQVELVRDREVSVLICGESGTGKEHVARLIHYESRVGSRPFVPIDCRALPASELKRLLPRLIGEAPDEESAAPARLPGTLYLAHVERLPRELQEKVVNVYGVPGERRPGQLRLLAGTSADLDECVQRELVQDELWLLLTSIVIEVPALRRRRDELPVMAQHFLESLNRGHPKQVGGFADAVWKLFAEYNWPGNLDELSAVVAEAHDVCDQPLIGPEHLPFRFRTGLDAQAVGPPAGPEPTPLEPFLVQVETDHIRRALELSRNNKSQAARLLGMTRNRLYRRMQALGIEDLEDAER